ncbi:MAG: hypothetical protein BJ554DRAFT_5740, partial [Olpidium bornovanus]
MAGPFPRSVSDSSHATVADRLPPETPSWNLSGRPMDSRGFPKFHHHAARSGFTSPTTQSSPPEVALPRQQRRATALRAAAESIPLKRDAGVTRRRH